MKKRILLISTAIIVLSLVSCNTNSDVPTPSSTPESSQESSEITPSSVPESSQEATSEIIPSSVPESSQEATSEITPSSVPESSQEVIPSSTPVTPPMTEEEKRIAEEKEFDLLLQLPTTYSVNLEQTTYSVGTETIKVIINNDGPGFLNDFNGYILEKYDGAEWINVYTLIPQSSASFINPNTEVFMNCKIDSLTEAGKYRVLLDYCHTGGMDNKKFEFTLE